MAFNPNISINSQGNVVGAPVVPKPTTPFVITGLKAAQPGGLGSTASNVLPKPFVAPANQQVATGNSVNTPSNGSIASLLTSSLPKPATGQMNSPSTVGAGISIGTSGQVETSKPSTALKSTTTNPDGSVSQTYHAPAAPSVDNSGGTANPNANYNAGVTQTPAAPGTPVSTPQPQSTAQGGTTAAGLLGTVAGFSNPDAQLSDLKSKMDALDADYASKTADIQNSPSDLNFQTGRLAAIQSEYNTAKAALNSNYQSLLQERGQNIGAAESALGTANNLQASPYGTPQVNPATGQVISGGQNITPNGTGSQGAIQPNDPAYSALQQYAQMAASGQISAIPSAWTSNPVINAQINDMAKQINPSYNPVASAALGGVQTQQISQQQGYQSALQQGQNLQSQLSDLITSFGLNPNDVNAVNIGIQKIAKNVSDPRYQILSNYVNDVANTYSQVLTPPGGSATDTTRSIASSMLDASASGQSILAVMKSLDQAAQAKIAGISTTGSSTGTANPWH